MNTFLKMKQEASGWPEWCQSENDRWRYIRDYHEKEGTHELFFALISHFHHLVADKIYTHHKNLVAGQHVEIFGRFGYVF
jgi:hypothetical protein